MPKPRTYRPRISPYELGLITGALSERTARIAQMFEDGTPLEPGGREALQKDFDASEDLARRLMALGPTD